VPQSRDERPAAGAPVRSGQGSEHQAAGALTAQPADLWSEQIRRGTFTSIKDLTRAIGTFIDGWIERCQPFVWTVWTNPPTNYSTTAVQVEEPSFTRSHDISVSKGAVPRHHHHHHHPAPTGPMQITAITRENSDRGNAIVETYPLSRIHGPMIKTLLGTTTDPANATSSQSKVSKTDPAGSGVSQ